MPSILRWAYPLFARQSNHGTALDLAGKGIADTGSLAAAIDYAITMVHARSNGEPA